MKTYFSILLLALMAAQSAPAANAPAAKVATGDTDTPVVLSKTPAAVQATIKNMVGGDKVDNIIRHKDDEGVIFAVEITKPDGSVRDLVIANDGILESMEVALDEVPGIPQKTIKTQAGANKIVSIDKTFGDEQTAYEVTISNALGEKNFTVAEDGRLERADISLREAPDAVAAAIKKQAGQEKIGTIEKVFASTDISYDVTLVDDKSGVEKTLTLGPDGALEGIDVTLGETPKAVQAAAVAVLGKNTLVSVTKNFDETGITYDFIMKPANGRERDFSIDDTGKLLTEQAFLEQLPATVQKTIADQIGNGKVIHIDKSYEPDSGVLPFQIYGFKNGKEFNFSVGPKGRFLGMDD